MNREHFRQQLKSIVTRDLDFSQADNYTTLSKTSHAANQNSTNSAFTEKWVGFNSSDEKYRMFEVQRKWYLELYGFKTEQALADFLKDKKFIFDAGCGLGYKAAWFAQLAPHATVIGMDFSESAWESAKNFDLPNLFYIQSDICEPLFKDGSIDFVSCDQVIMHTEDPEKTFAELSRITNKKGEFACYFYAKKALPRELIDDYFRTHCTNMSYEELMEMSEQLTELGKRLCDLNVTFDAPAIPALGMKGGKIDIQRFIYWNFLKCYWNEEVGRKTSDITNFDWYSPSNARRFSKDEVERIVQDNDMKTVTFHEEEACYSGRFAKRA